MTSSNVHGGKSGSHTDSGYDIPGSSPEELLFFVLFLLLLLLFSFKGRGERGRRQRQREKLRKDGALLKTTKTLGSFRLVSLAPLMLALQTVSRSSSSGLASSLHGSVKLKADVAEETERLLILVLVPKAAPLEGFPQTLLHVRAHLKVLPDVQEILDASVLGSRGRLDVRDEEEGFGIVLGRINGPDDF